MKDQEARPDDENAWYANARRTHDLKIADTMEEVKTFAYQAFDKIDADQDGFISKEELKSALRGKDMDWRAKSFISFLLRRMDDIAQAYEEEWAGGGADGISRVDIQEYFNQIAQRL